MLLTDAPVAIRRGTWHDAPEIVVVWTSIVEERVYSAVDRPFTIESERKYLQSMSEREALFLAQTTNGQVVGFQTIDQWTNLFHSMDHVAQLGTFVLREHRGLGIGKQLAAHTLAFARSVGYEKLVIFVRASNTGAQSFYAGIGFRPCGRLARQVKIDGKWDDEVMMEVFL